MSKPKKGEPGYAAYRERENARSALDGRAAVRPRAGDEPRHGNGGRE